jgi:hypothetical protein
MLMRTSFPLTVVGLCLLAFVSPVLAQSPATKRPPALKRLVDCRSIAAQLERLACYDKEVAAMDAAEARRDLVVMDREQVKKTRRTLFGLTLPNLGILGDDSDSDEEGTGRLDTTIKAATQNPAGKWILTLQDGGVWAQVDSRALQIDPRPGHDIKIRRAALGSYLANVKGQTAIRVQRVR